MNKAGSLYKAGVTMANSRLVLEAAKRVSLQAVKEKENAAQKREEKEEQLLVDGVSAFRQWVAEGRLFWRKMVTNTQDQQGSMLLLVCECHSHTWIIKARQKMKDFSTAKACVKWLGEIGMGATWDEEMQVLEGKLEDDGLEGRLF